MKKAGRTFDCSKCPEAVQKIRRCREDRWDFGPNDGAIWPMFVQKGGDAYGFCPAKSTWDGQILYLYRLLVLAYETKTLLYKGGIAEQPSWFIELLSWFIPRYDHHKFYSRAKSILGSDDKKTKVGSQSRGVHKGRTKSQNKR